MDWTSLLQHPVFLWTAGLLILTVTLFSFARRKYLRKKRTLLSVLDEEDEKWKQRAILSSELLERFEKRARDLLAEHRRLDDHLTDQRNNLQGLVDEANKTMERLKRLIDSFDKTFYEDSQGNSSVSTIFRDLQDDFVKHMESLISPESRTETAKPTETSQPVETAKNDDTGDHAPVDNPFDDLDRLLNSLGESDSTASAAESSEMTLETADSQNGSDSPVARSRLIRKLMEQGKNSDEIANELGMSQADVDIVIRVLRGDRRVA